MQQVTKIIISSVIACVMTYGLGYGHLEDAGDVARSTFFTLTTAALFFYSLYRRWACSAVSVIATGFALYMVLGVGVDYGPPNMSLVASLLETNANESLEFLTNLSWRDCFLSVLTLILLFFYRFVFFKKFQNTPLQFKKSLWAALLIVNIFGLFTYHSVVAYKKYLKEQPVVGEGLQAVDWEIQTIKRNLSLKVLVVGESVSKRYLSVMGSPWGTTPFLAGSPKVKAFTQYYSPAPNTVTSLSRTLTYSQVEDGAFDLNRNVVSLAKAAGYSTLWASNQRSMGPNDSSVARMAHQADKHRFLDKVPVIEPAKDDFALLNYLRAQLEQSKDFSKEGMIFLHMLGSHPHACSRVPDMPINLYAGNGRHIDCYLASLQKLDLFLKTLTELLAQHSEDYEVLYVSDHSLRVAPMSATEKMMDRLRLPTKNIYVQPQTREAYDTPLLFIDSKQQAAQKSDVPLSGFDFLHLFGNWIGVTSPLINPAKNLDNPSSSAPIQVFNWSRMVSLDSLPDTQPIAPR